MFPDRLTQGVPAVALTHRTWQQVWVAGGGRGGGGGKSAPPQRAKPAGRSAARSADRFSPIDGSTHAGKRVNAKPTMTRVERAWLQEPGPCRTDQPELLRTALRRGLTSHLLVRRQGPGPALGMWCDRRWSAQEREPERVHRVSDIHVPVAVRVQGGDASWSLRTEKEPVEDAHGVRDVDRAVVVAVSAQERRDRWRSCSAKRHAQHRSRDNGALSPSVTSARVTRAGRHDS